MNTEGGQVVDTWAFCVDDADEYLSMEHSRSANYTLLFKPGERLFSNRFRPLLRLLDDTSPGYHDTLHA
ncbi:MAG: urea carboxylase-associated family protein, partial [Chromatiales bacterium]|nr:urea carboxylase-associated family protein [Chromatiales bacterium]